MSALVLLGLAVTAGCYLLGNGWADLGVAMTVYAAVITILIFGWTLRDTLRLRRDEVDIAEVATFLKDLGVEKYSQDQLNPGQRDALAKAAGREGQDITRSIQLCLSPATPAKRHRIVLLFDGSIWQITIGGRAGGYTVQPLLRVAVPESEEQLAPSGRKIGVTGSRA
jgi:hypothetical protein